MNMAEYAISWQSWVGAAEKCPFWTHYKRTLKWYFLLGPSEKPGMGFFCSFFSFSAKENVIDLSCVMIYHYQVHFSITLPNCTKKIEGLHNHIATQRGIVNVISEGATRHFVSIFGRLGITNGQRRKKCKMISWPKAFSFQISRYLDLRQYNIPAFQNSILVLTVPNGIAASSSTPNNSNMWLALILIAKFST